MANPWSNFAASDYKIPNTQPPSSFGPLNVSTNVNVPNVGLPNPKSDQNLLKSGASYIGESLIEGGNLNDFRREMGRSPNSEQEMKDWLNRDITLQDKVTNLQSDMSGALARVNEADKQNQDNQQAQQDAINKGGTPVADPTKSTPGETLSGMNQNSINGVDNPQKDIKVPNVDDQLNALLNNTGKKISFDENKVPTWWKSNSFNMGLLNFGLNLLSGKNLAQAFAAGSQTFQSMHGAEKREAYKQELIDGGYDPTFVDQWIEDGDAHKLEQGSPQAKAQQKLQQASDVQTLKGQMIANSPEMQQLNMDIKTGQLRNQQEDNALRRQELDLRQKAFDLKQQQMGPAGGYNWDSRTINAEKSNGKMKVINTLSQKDSYFSQARDNITNLRDALAKGDSQRARALYQQAVMDMARGEVGEGRSLQGADLSHFAQDPSILTTGTNSISLKAGFSPNESSVAYLERSLEGAHSATEATMSKALKDRIDFYAAKPGWDKRRATFFVEQASGVPYDPYNVKGVAEDDIQF